MRGLVAAVAVTMLILTDGSAQDEASQPLPVRTDYYPVWLAEFGFAPLDITADPNSDVQVNTSIVRVLFSPSLAAPLLLEVRGSRLSETSKGGLQFEDIVSIHATILPYEAQKRKIVDGVNVTTSSRVHFYVERTTGFSEIERIARSLVTKFTYFVARPPKIPCVDGMTIYVEAYDDHNGRSLVAAHSCDGGFEVLLDAVAPIIEIAAADLSPIASGLTDYGEQRFRGAFDGVLDDDS